MMSPVSSSAPVLSVAGLHKTYREGRTPSRTPDKPAAPAVSGVSIDVRPGEMLTLLGPSGCGKTTTLRCVAGLETPDAGSIRLRERTLFDGGTGENVAPNRRGLAMVFQSYAIWPHMTVFGNVAFPLEVMPRRQRPGRSVIRQRVDRALATVGLPDYAGRPATNLSGGQQQRLALARAMVTEPELMLLDEPLSNLDAKLRESMRLELKRLQKDAGVASIYVTHDQEEALVLSDRVVVMNNGDVEQIGRPTEIYGDPRTRFVAEFVGTSNMVEGVVAERSGTLTRVDTVHGPIWACPAETPAVGSQVLLSVRPEAVEIVEAPSETSRNEWKAVVVTTAFLGDAVDRILRIRDWNLRVRSNPSVVAAGESTVVVRVAPQDVRVLPDR